MKKKQVMRLFAAGLCTGMLFTTMPGVTVSAEELYEDTAVSDTAKTSDVTVDAEHFPDETFRNYILNNLTDGGTILTADKIQSVRGLDLHGVTNLEGLQYFTSLTRLNFYENAMESITLPKLNSLTNVSVEDNNAKLYALKHLSLEACPNITYVSLCDASMTSQDDLVLAEGTQLNTLLLHHCKDLHSWDFSRPEYQNLHELVFNGWNGYDPDFSPLTNLTSLTYQTSNFYHLSDSTQIPEYPGTPDISMLTGLTSLDLEINNSDIDFSRFPNLSWASVLCTNAQTLDFSSNSNLRSLHVRLGNKNQTFALPANRDTLRSLSVSAYEMPLHVDVSDYTALKNVLDNGAGVSGWFADKNISNIDNPVIFDMPASITKTSESSLLCTSFATSSDDPHYEKYKYYVNLAKSCGFTGEQMQYVTVSPVNIKDCELDKENKRLYLNLDWSKDADFSKDIVTIDYQYPASPFPERITLWPELANNQKTPDTDDKTDPSGTDSSDTAGTDISKSDSSGTAKTDTSKTDSSGNTGAKADSSGTANTDTGKNADASETKNIRNAENQDTTEDTKQNSEHAEAGKDRNAGKKGGSSSEKAEPVKPDTSCDLHELQNPVTGDYFYTESMQERTNLVKAGWKYCGIITRAPYKSKTPIYRLFSVAAAKHHYTTSKEECDILVKNGWTLEGIAWYSNDKHSLPVYRMYNAKTGAHKFAPSEKDKNALMKKGWTAEGVGWYMATEK